jgi:hypothetical protein
MADFLTELFEQFSPEEQARLRAAEASANAVLANGDAEVRSRLRFAGSLDDRNWLLEPQDDARANAAGIIFVSYVNALWTNTDRAREESVLGFLGKVDKLIPPVLDRFGAWESRAMISELRAECERGAWRVHAGLRGDADLNATYARHSRHNGHGAGRQEDLLKDARAWAEEELRGLSVDVEDTSDLQRRVVKRVWDEFVPRHRYHADFQLGYREFASALWKEGLPSLEELATVAVQERAASGSQTAQASDPEATNRSKQSILLGALAAMPDPNPDVGSDGKAESSLRNSSLERSQGPTDGSAPTVHETDRVEPIAEEADPFVIAYEEIAAKTEETLAAFKRKVTAPKKRVLYQDIEHAIWTTWQIRPDDVTVHHINEALLLLSRNSEGGVELDQDSCAVYGIDYSRLVTMMRASILNAGDGSASPKVPRMAGTDTEQTSQRNKPDQPPDSDETVQVEPKTPGRRGRKTIFTQEQLNEARQMKSVGKINNEIAKLLYRTNTPTPGQRRSVSTTLRHHFGSKK